jgi:hypothetical protein
MTRAEALQDLLAKIETGYFGATPNRAARFNDFWKLAEIALDSDVRSLQSLAWDAYNEHSIDAAKALHEAVLTEWAWTFHAGDTAWS